MCERRLPRQASQDSASAGARAESCKDAVDSRSFQETDEVKPEALPIYGAGERNVTELLEAEKGHYVFEKDTLEEEVFEYMQTTNLFLPCYARK